MLRVDSMPPRRSTSGSLSCSATAVFSGNYISIPFKVYKVNSKFHSFNDPEGIVCHNQTRSREKHTTELWFKKNRVFVECMKHEANCLVGLVVKASTSR